MAFRADEAAYRGYEEVRDYLVPRKFNEDDRLKSEDAFQDIVDKYGPVIDSYPTWHPLVCNHSSREAVTTPSSRCGYKGLDHTRYFANAFITCPYGDGQEVLDSVAELPLHHIADVKAEKLDVTFYNSEATPILVTCEWQRPLAFDGMIPLSLALPLILEREIPCWRWSEVGETWETMRRYFLGSPHGSRSSLFVSQETGQAIKKIWNSLIYTGMFGDIKVSDT